ARRYGLNTDSSYRFERGVDFNLSPVALERATQLLLEIAGGKAGPVVSASDATCFPTREQIKLRKNRIKALLGISLADSAVTTMLQRLVMQVTAVAEGWEVVPPSYRYDIALEADLLEELARIYGYDAIAATSPAMRLQFLP